jgi:ribosomal protein S18 acetylase RimI-like enzyme
VRYLKGDEIEKWCRARNGLGSLDERRALQLLIGRAQFRPEEFIVAEREGRFIGSLRAPLFPGPGAYVAMEPPLVIDGFAFTEVAHELVECAIETARAQGAHSVWASLSGELAQREALRRLYAQTGFTLLQERISLACRLNRLTAYHQADPLTYYSLLEVGEDEGQRLLDLILQESPDRAAAEIHAEQVLEDYRARAAGRFDYRQWAQLAFRDGDPVGLALPGYDEILAAGSLYCLGIVPAQRGRGYGRFLLHRVLTYLRALGVQSCSVSVDSAHQPRWQLFRKAGFAPQGRAAVYLLRI